MTLTEPPPQALVDRLTRPLSAGLAVGITATGVYGGYFGAAQGVVLLALLGIAWSADLHRANGAKVVLAGMANLVSASIFAFSGKVDWRIAALIAVGSAVGGLIGVWVDRPGERRVTIPDEHIAAARAAAMLVIRSLTELPGLLGLPA